jgi:hypothetical protein
LCYHKNIYKFSNNCTIGLTWPSEGVFDFHFSQSLFPSSIIISGIHLKKIDFDNYMMVSPLAHSIEQSVVMTRLFIMTVVVYAKFAHTSYRYSSGSTPIGHLELYRKFCRKHAFKHYFNFTINSTLPYEITVIDNQTLA